VLYETSTEGPDQDNTRNLWRTLTCRPLYPRKYKVEDELRPTSRLS